MTPTPILERIKERENGKVIRIERTPAWIRRMREQGLPSKDMTGYRRPDGDAA